MLLGFGFFLIPESNLRTKDIMKISFSFGEKYRLRTFLLITIGISFYLFFSNLIRPLLIPSYQPQILLNSLNPSSRNWIYIIYFDLSLLLLQGIFQPLIFCFITVQKIEIEIKKNILLKELSLMKTESEFEMKIIKRDLKSQKMDEKTIAYTLKSKGGSIKYYCPHCGLKINPDPTLEKGFMKCPHCNEQVYIIQRKK